MRIAFLNVMSGMNITKGYWQYVQFHYKLAFPHSSDAVSRAAEEVRRLGVDVFGTVEVDAGSRRTRFVDQAELVARHSGLSNYRFFPTYAHKDIAHQGNCLHSRFPILSTKNHYLPGKGEPRYLSESVVDHEGTRIVFLVTHLSLKANFREMQIDAIAKIVDAHSEPVVLMGDFNVYDHQEFGLLEKSKLNKVFTAPTFPSWRPRKHFDVVFMSRRFRVIDEFTCKKKFSDHLMLVCDIELAE